MKPHRGPPKKISTTFTSGMLMREVLWGWSDSVGVQREGQELSSARALSSIVSVVSFEWFLMWMLKNAAATQSNLLNFPEFEAKVF